MLNLNFKIMRKFFASLMTLMVFLMLPLMLLAQEVEPAEETNWIVVIIATVIIILESVVARIIPGKYDGILGTIVTILKMLSDYLNRDKEDK